MKKIIAGNWKMNLTPKEGVDFINGIKDGINTSEQEVVLCVPFTCLAPVLEEVAGTNIGVGAQNMHFEDSGAFTGEVSAKMLASMGVGYVIVGHSERREYFGETDEGINKKAKKALETGIVPIICCGEMLREREQGITTELVRRQLKIALLGISSEDVRKCVIAYEPIWAIGTGVTATAEQAEEVCASVRSLIEELYGKDTAKEVRIQYGGSVNGQNAASLFSMPNIDGGLVGGASLKPDFEKIVNWR